MELARKGGGGRGEPGRELSVEDEDRGENRGTSCVLPT